MKAAIIGLAVAVASLVMILFGYRMCTTVAQIEDVLPRWAREHDFRIVHEESRTFFQGPYVPCGFRLVYYVTVEDKQRRHRTAWVCLGWWYLVGFMEFIEVRWDE